jgi:hypothetical protein
MNWPKILFSVLLAVSLVSCSGKDAAKDKGHERVILPAGKIHEGWYFAAGDQVVIEGTVNGDAYIAGGVIDVDGTINGDLLVAGGQLNINGTISDDVRSCGGTIQFDGHVGKNITACGGNITIGKSATINGNALVAGGIVQFVGIIAQNATVASGNMNVRGTIDGNVDFAGGELSILPGAKVGGNLSVEVEQTKNVEIAEGTVFGKVDLVTEEMKPSPYILGLQVWQFWFKIIWICSLLVTGLVIILVFPKQFVGFGSTIVQLPGQTFLWGFAGMILIPVAVAILFVTIIGVPLGLLLLATFLWMLYVSQLSLGVVLGGRIMGMEGKTGWNLFLAFAAGLLIVYILTFVPYLRIFIYLGSLSFGLGAILLVLKNEFQKGGT